MEDKKIIRLLKTNPQEGLRAAIETYRGGVHAITSRILQKRNEDVEECVADTFFRIWKAAEKGQIDPDTETFRGLVYSTARNVALTRYRKLAREQAVLVDEDTGIAAEIDILGDITRSETSRELKAAVLAMPEPDRQIFFRRYYLFESVKEIAGRVGCTEVQVKNRLYRGKQLLQKALQGKETYLETVGC